MSSATAEPVGQTLFSVPLRHWRSANLSGSEATFASKTVGLQRFVGDEPNEILKILAADSGGMGMQRMSATGTQWPLVLFGPPGAGKTALALTFLTNLTPNQGAGVSMPGAGSQTKMAQPIVLSAEDFDRRFRSAIETDSVKDFRRYLFGCAGILIDNLHALANKKNTQQEIAGLIDSMASLNRPVVFTCHASPLEFQPFLPTLVSRLTRGLTLPVALPGKVARKEIIRDLADINRLRFSDDAINWLIDRLPTSVPAINHFLIQLKTRIQAEDSGQPLKDGLISVNQLIDWFQPAAKDQHKFAELVIRSVAAEFKLKASELTGSSRKLTVARARSIAIYLSRSLGKISFARIGKQFGNRDHTTIMHSFRKIDQIVSRDSDSNDNSIIVVRAVNKLKQNLAPQLDDAICLDQP